MIPLLIVSTYQFAGIFLRSVVWRRWVTILASVGGGLGWVLVLFGASDWLGSLPLEFFSPETFGFLSIYGLPHLILARAAWLAAASWYLADEKGWRAGFALLVAGIVHPPLLLPAVAAATAHQISLMGMGRNSSVWFRRLVRLLIPSVPLVGYLGWSILTDPYLQAWAEQNVIRSPHPVHYLVAYGALVPAAVLGARRLLRERSSTGLFPVSWVIIAPGLAYAPLELQRRLTDGVWVVLLILAALGIEGASRMRRRQFRMLLSTLLLPSTALLLAFGIRVARAPGEPVFRDGHEIAAFATLRAEAPQGSTVLAAFETGNAVPAWAPVRVVAGHGPETVGLAEILPRIASFYGATLTEDERSSFLISHSVDFVFWGPRERALGDFSPGESACLESIFSESGYELFRVCER
jgi:hypothetical protein